MSKQERSFQKQLIGVALAVTGSALLLACGLLFFFQDREFRERMVRDLDNQALIVAANSEAALFFEDPADAELVLDTLRGLPSIRFAGLYLADGRPLAEYSRAGSTWIPSPVDGPGDVFTADGLATSRNVDRGDSNLGRVVLHSDLSELAAFRRRTALAVSASLLLALVLALFEARRLGRSVSRPILELAETARKITQDENYALRAEPGTTREVAALTRSFNDLLERVERTVSLERQLRNAQKMEAIGRLAGGVAHDFNNLLQVIVTHLYALKTKSPGREVDEIGKATRSATDLVRQLLTFGRHSAANHRPISLTNEVEGALRMIRRTLLGPGIECVSSFAPDLRLILGDPGEIQQIVVNLCVNARDAMPAGGRVEIELVNQRIEPNGNKGEHEDWVELTIRDNGSGMNDEVQARALEPFFTTKAAGRGTGLGLATVFGIVSRAGGRMQISSKVGKGTTIKVLFPALGPALERPPSREAPLTLQPTDERGAILYVEDDESVRTATQRVLESGGHQVLAAGTPEEALEIAGRHREQIRLLLSDVVLPDADGRELAREIAKEIPNLPVLFLSGFAPVVAEGRRSGHHEILAKPVEPDVLLGRVDHLLGITTDSRADPGSVLIVEDNPVVREALERIVGYLDLKSLTASCLSEARAVLAAHPTGIGIMIVDLQLPDGEGTELVHEACAHHPPIPSILTSGESLSELDLPDGPVQILQKPFLPEDLRRRLALLIQRKTSEPG